MGYYVVFSRPVVRPGIPHLHITTGTSSSVPIHFAIFLDLLLDVVFLHALRQDTSRGPSLESQFLERFRGGVVLGVFHRHFCLTGLVRLRVAQGPEFVLDVRDLLGWCQGLGHLARGIKRHARGAAVGDVHGPFFWLGLSFFGLV